LSDGNGVPRDRRTTPEHPTVQALRKVLLAALLLGIVGTLTELLLLEHTEGTWQKVPLVLLGLGALSLVVRFLRPRSSSLRLLRGVMILFVASGLVGIYLHYRGNVELELEMVPSRSGFDLFREAIGGATPALAPGTMVQLGLIGLGYCLRHPLVRE
jgi:hypothetical protein